MDFWTFLIVIILGVTTIQAVQDIMKRRAVGGKELDSLREEITTIRQDIEEIKESIADLIIHNDRLT